MRCAIPSVDDLRLMAVTKDLNQTALQDAVLDKVHSEFGRNQGDLSPVLAPTLELDDDGASDNKASRLVSDDIMCRCDETVMIDGQNECVHEQFKATLASGDTCADALGDYLL